MTKTMIIETRRRTTAVIISGYQRANESRDGSPPTRHPERTARNVVLRIARQVLLQLELNPASPPSALAPELIVFALTPYLGLAEAQRWARAHGLDAEARAASSASAARGG